MDVIKTEPEVDPFTVQSCDDAVTEEGNPSPDEENLLDLHVTRIKEECADESCEDHNPEIKFQEIKFPNNFAMVKCEIEEGKLSHLEATGMKAECMDDSCEVKSEIKVEDSPVPMSFAFVKSEVDEDLSDVDRVQQELKEEVPLEEDEVFPESRDECDQRGTGSRSIGYTVE
ncbi:uncharacterized protein PF3D7_1120000-like isoform X5 [Periplaneta americana]|uniref:uncharacterized protein PF3D7_1120000-like isoform X5 n=1 Tax=Periplaneta americana TaxID=6978 RepID=UPI0037E78089